MMNLINILNFFWLKLMEAGKFKGDKFMNPF
mgnify:CR=1 FL=1